MSETLLLSLGYFSDEELRARAARGACRCRRRRCGSAATCAGRSRWWATPSPRCARCAAATSGARVQEHLGRDSFKGLRLVCTGNIPQGGFSSSSAVTVATKNAINALFDLGIPPDLLVHLACQAEYGTGVRAGSLDQATEQKGRAGQGTLISSNPRDNYRIIGTYPVPTDRFHDDLPLQRRARPRGLALVVGRLCRDRRRRAPLTAGEMRKMTGKAAEIAALLTRLPLDTDFFKQIEDDLVADGLLSRESRAWICSILRQVPLLISQDELRRARAAQSRLVRRAARWRRSGSTGRPPTQKADATLDVAVRRLARPAAAADDRRRARSCEEQGVPLRAMVAYLFGEVAKNFYLIHHPDEWIECVTRSQRGDRCVDIDPDRLPGRAGRWSASWTGRRASPGPELLDRWLERHGATPFDYNRGLDDASLAADEPAGVPPAGGLQLLPRPGPDRPGRGDAQAGVRPRRRGRARERRRPGRLLPGPRGHAQGRARAT